MHDTEEGHIGLMESDCDEETFLKLHREKDEQGSSIKDFITFLQNSKDTIDV